MSSGGKREGAGRKKTQLSRVTGVGHGAGLRKIVAEEILADLDEKALWSGLAQHEEPKVRLNALKYLTDRRDGKAPQAVSMEVSGPDKGALNVQNMTTEQIDKRIAELLAELELPPELLAKWNGQKT